MNLIAIFHLCAYWRIGVSSSPTIDNTENSPFISITGSLYRLLILLFIFGSCLIVVQQTFYRFNIHHLAD